MNLYVHRVDLADSPLPSSELWDLNRVGRSVAAQLVVEEVSAAPAGKHDLAMCPQYEGIWRLHAPTIVSLLAGPERGCFVWAMGPLTCDGLVRVLRFVDCWNDGGARFHVEGVTSWERRPGYRTSWILFEFQKETFAEMMGDESLDLEFVSLRMLLLGEGSAAELPARSFDEFGLRWIVERGAIALLANSHFEGCAVVGSYDAVGQAMARIGDLVVRE